MYPFFVIDDYMHDYSCKIWALVFWEPVPFIFPFYGDTFNFIDVNKISDKRMLTDPSVTGEISVNLFGIMEHAIARGNFIAIASIVVYISNSFLFRLFYSMYIFFSCPPWTGNSSTRRDQKKSRTFYRWSKGIPIPARQLNWLFMLLLFHVLLDC
jgi:hypothetical protein